MDSLPTATSPRPAEDTEVLSQRIPEQGATIMETPQGKILDAEHMGGKTPMDYADGSRSKSGSPPVNAPEPSRVPDASGQPLAKEGEPAVPMTSAHPEEWDNLLEALRGASIDDEHHTLMSMLLRRFSPPRAD